MNTQHTPTPWTANAFPCDIHGPDGLPVASTSYPHTTEPRDQRIRMANARRIVACVNACEGINPEAVPDLLEALGLLLAGAEQAVKAGLIQPQVNGGIVLARAAIAKAQTIKGQ